MDLSWIAVKTVGSGRDKYTLEDEWLEPTAITHLERKMIWIKPQWLCSMFIFQGVNLIEKTRFWSLHRMVNDQPVQLSSWAVEQNPPSDIPLAKGFASWVVGKRTKNIPNDDWMMIYHGRIRKKRRLKQTQVHWVVHHGVLIMVYECLWLSLFEWGVCHPLFAATSPKVIWSRNHVEDGHCLSDLVNFNVHRRCLQEFCNFFGHPQFLREIAGKIICPVHVQSPSVLKKSCTWHCIFCHSSDQCLNSSPKFRKFLKNQRTTVKCHVKSWFVHTDIQIECCLENYFSYWTCPFSGDIRSFSGVYPVPHAPCMEIFGHTFGWSLWYPLVNWHSWLEYPHVQ